MTTRNVPFNRPFATGRELQYIAEAVANHHLSGDGPFTKRCNAWLEQTIGCGKALLTHSCTAALEMAAILADIQPGDEVIMPSFTFVSTANAFVLRGAVPVFADIDPVTLNLDPACVADAVTEKTRAIVPVHYAGVGCDMSAIGEIAKRHGLTVIEDAAQAILCTHHGKPLGGFGAMAALSFHETKNLMCGEGGALLINDPALIERAEIVREKGTNRSRFFRGQVDKYTWIDVGSSFLPNEITAAFLWAQLEQASEICGERMRVWHAYHAALEPIEQAGFIERPRVPPHDTISGHMYYVLLPSLDVRTRVLERMNADGAGAVFHYVPLHSSPAGLRFGRAHGELAVTQSVSDRLIRLPLWPAMTEADVEAVARALAVAVEAATPVAR